MVVGTKGNTISNNDTTLNNAGKLAPYANDEAKIYYCPSFKNEDLSGHRFDEAANLSKFQTGSYCQSSYQYRKFRDQTNYHDSKLNSGDAILADAFFEYWGDQAGTYNHGGIIYNTLYVDGSVSAVMDSGRWCIVTSWGSVALANNDISAWASLFDR